MGDRIIQVTAGVIRRDGFFLAARRPEGDSLGGYWEFPGGKIEPGETPEACLVREIDEELGLAIRVEASLCRVTHAYPGKTIELLVYLCRTDGEPTRLEAHSEVRWLTLAEMDGLQWAPADVPVLEELRKRPNGCR